MQRFRDSRYAAGLWEDSLFHDMLWIPNPVGLGQKQSSWIAPSWSWASMQGAVRYIGYQVVYRPVRGQVICFVFGGDNGTLETAGGVMVSHSVPHT